MSDLIPQPGPTLSAEFVQSQEATAADLDTRADLQDRQGQPLEAAKTRRFAAMVRGTLAEAKQVAGYVAPRAPDMPSPSDVAHGIQAETPLSPRDWPQPTEHADEQVIRTLAGALSKMRASEHLQRAVLNDVAGGKIGDRSKLKDRLETVGMDAGAVDQVSSLLARYGAGLNIAKLPDYSLVLLAAHAKHIARGGR